MAQQQQNAWENDPNWGEPITDPNWGTPVAQPPLATNHSPTTPRLPQGPGPSAAALSLDRPRTAWGGMGRIDPKSWLSHYPGLGSNGQPNEWARLLSSAVEDGQKNGWITEADYNDLITGKMKGERLNQVLTQYKGGAVNPWVPEPAQLNGWTRLQTAVARTNPLVWLTYGANQLLGTNAFGLSDNGGVNPMGRVGSEQDERAVASMETPAMLAQSLPFGILGRVAGAVIGGGTDASIEAMRQKELTGEIDPLTVAGQGALGAAANFLPGLGWLGQGGRVARAAKGAAVMGPYAAGSNMVANLGNERLGATGPDGEPLRYDLMEGTPLATLLGAGLSAAGPKVRARGGKWNEPGVVGQFREAQAAAKASASPRVATATAPAAAAAAPAGQPSPAGQGADRLKQINQQLREMARNRQYDSPEYQALIQEADTLRAAAVPQAQPKPEDIQQRLDAARQELAALKAAGIKSERSRTLQNRVRRLEKQVAAPAATAQPSSGVTTPSTPAAAPTAAGPASDLKVRLMQAHGIDDAAADTMIRTAQQRANLSKVPTFLGVDTAGQPLKVDPGGVVTAPAAAKAAGDPNAPLDLTNPVKAAAQMRAENPQIDQQAAALRARAAEAKHALKKGAPGKLTLPTPPTPLRAKGSRFVSPAASVEDLRARDPKTYTQTKNYIDQVIRRMGYAAGREHLENIIQNRQPTTLLKGADDKLVVKSTTVLSKNPHNLGLVWQEQASGYEARAKQAGQQRPVEALRAVEVKGAPDSLADEVTKTNLAHYAQRVGREDLLEALRSETMTVKEAQSTLASLKATAKQRKIAGYVPPTHKGSPLSVWSLADLEKAAARMFSTKKSTVTQPNRHQVLAAGSRLMERLERMTAGGKDPQKAAAMLMEMAQGGRIKESRLHAKGTVSLMDWLGGEGSHLPKVKAKKPATKTFTPGKTDFSEELPDLTSGIDTSEAFPLGGAPKTTDALLGEEIDVLGGEKLPKVAAAVAKMAEKDAAAPPVKKAAPATADKKAARTYPNHRQLETSVLERRIEIIKARGTKADQREIPLIKAELARRAAGGEIDPPDWANKPLAKAPAMEDVVDVQGRKVGEKPAQSTEELKATSARMDQEAAAASKAHWEGKSFKALMKMRAGMGDDTFPDVRAKMTAELKRRGMPQFDDQETAKRYLEQEEKAEANLGDKLMAAAPIGIAFGSDDEDTNTYMQRLAMLGVGAVGGGKLLGRARKAWRVAGKPVAVDVKADPGRSVAVVSDKLEPLKGWVQAVRAKFPAFAERINLYKHPEPVNGQTAYKVVIPNELGQDAGFTQAFTKTIEDLEAKAKVEATTQAQTKIPAAPVKANLDDVFEGDIGAEDFEGLGGPTEASRFEDAPEFDPNELSAADFDEVGADGKPKKLTVPLFAAGEKIEPLERVSPPTRSTKPEDQFTYDPREDHRVRLRDPKAMDPHEAEIRRQMAAQGMAIVPHQGDVWKRAVWNRQDPDDPINKKLAEIRETHPFAQPSVEKMPDGKFAIRVNFHGMYGPRVTFKGTDGRVQQAHMPEGWKGWRKAYEDDLKAGKAQDPTAKFMGRVGGRMVGTVETGPMREVNVEGKRIGVPDTPVGVARFQKTPSAARLQALGDAFPGLLDQTAAGVYKHLDLVPTGDGVALTINRRYFDSLTAGEREYLHGLANAPDPKTYVYGEITEPQGKPLGIDPETFKRSMEAREGVQAVVPAGLDPTAARAAQVRQLGQRILKLTRAIDAEQDPAKKLQLQNQRKAVEKMQNRLFFQRPKDATRTGDLTLKQAVTQHGFKIIEEGSEQRMAEIRAVLKETFGEDYTKHFAMGFRKGQGGGKYVMALSPEFLASESRERITRANIKRQRQALRSDTGSAKPVREPDAQRFNRIFNPQPELPIKVGSVVEVRTKGGVERGAVTATGENFVVLKTKGASIRASKDAVRLVETDGRRVGPAPVRVAPFQDNDLIRPLVEHLTGKTDLTDADFTKVWRMAKDESERRGEKAFDTLRQMYADAGLEAPRALKQSYGLDPFDVIQDLLWNQQRKRPTVAQQFKFARDMDGVIDELIRKGLVDPEDRANARLELLRRYAAMADTADDADRVEQIQRHLAQLQEAVGGLPRDPFGEIGGSAATKPGQKPGASTRPGSSTDRDPYALLNQLRLQALATAAEPGPALARSADTFGRMPGGQGRRAIVPAARDIPGLIRKGQLPTTVMPLTNTERAQYLKGVPDPTRVTTYAPEISVMAPDADPAATVAAGHDAIVVFDRAGTTQPKAAKALSWVPLPSGSRLYADVVRTGAPGQRPLTFTDLWKAAGQWNLRNPKQRLERLLNPSPSDIQRLLQKVKVTKGRQAKLLIVGDDAQGVVDFAVRGHKTFDFRAALQQLATTLKKPVTALTKADLKADWRLMAALPTALGISASEAEAATDEDGPAVSLLKGLLPTASLLAAGGAGAIALRKLRSRAPTRHLPTGPTQIEALGARQKDTIAKARTPKPFEVSATATRQALQNQFIAIEKEQAKYPTSQLLPEERAWDVWSTTLGGGGGRTDAAMQRMRDTVVEARKAGLIEALHDEWNLRSNLGLVDWAKGRELEWTATLGQLRQQKAAIEAAMQQPGANKFQLGGQLRHVNAKLKVAKVKFGAASRMVSRMNQGTILPGGLTPTTLAQEATQLRNRLSPAEQMQVRTLADRLSQETRFIIEDMHDAGILSLQQRNRLLSRGNYINVRKVVTQLLQTRQKRMGEVFGNADISVASEKIIKYLKDPAGLDPAHPLQGTMLWIREANQELAQQRAAKSLVQLLALDPQNQVRRVNPNRKQDAAWMRQQDMAVVSYLHDGKAQHYAVPRLFGELVVAAGTVPPQAEGFMKAVQGIKNAAQAGMTWLNIPFMAANVIRDVEGARKFLRGEAFSALNPADWAKTYVEWGQAFTEVLKNSRDFQQMLEEGASYSTFTKGLDPNRYLDLLEKDILGQKGPGIYVRNLREAANAFEEATKLMVWKRLRDAGEGSLDRAVLTRRFGGSPDFWVRGTWAQGLGMLHLFFNPAVQGVDQTIKGLGRNKNWAWAAAGATGVAALASQWNDQFRDEQGQPELAHVERSVREANFVLLLPLTRTLEDGTRRNLYIAVPKSHAAQLLHTPIEAAVAAVKGTGEGLQDAKRALSSTVSKLLPLSAGMDLERPGSIVDAWKASLNPVLRLPWEIGSDRQFFGDRPIEGAAFENVRRSDRFRESTPLLFRDLGKAATPFTSDGQGLSPLQLRHIIRGLSPGPVDLATDLYERANQALGRRGTPNPRIPVLGQLERRFVGPTVGDQVLEDLRTRFYSALEQARTEATTARRLPADDPERKPLARNPARMLETMSQQLAQIRRARTDLQRKLGDPGTNPEVQRARIKRLTEAERRVLEAAGKALDRFGPRYKR